MTLARLDRRLAGLEKSNRVTGNPLEGLTDSELETAIFYCHTLSADHPEISQAKRVEYLSEIADLEVKLGPMPQEPPKWFYGLLRQLREWDGPSQNV